MSIAKFTLARNTVVLALLGLFVLQLFRVKGLIGGLTGSLVFRWVNLLDLFAFTESGLSSRSFTLAAFSAAAPVLAIYFFLGRAFCGWACPLDLTFRGINRVRSKGGRHACRGIAPAGDFPALHPPKRPQAWKGYVIPSGFLILSFFAQVPFFTSYLSPITNFYRSIYAGFYWLSSFPGEFTVLAVSLLILSGFLLLEFFKPRLWCRMICPVGKTYGLFNRLSFLHVTFSDGACSGCRRCLEACYMGVEILSSANRKKIRDTSCILCGRCVEACGSQQKILKLRLAR